jgi:VanZ family protein
MNNAAQMTRFLRIAFWAAVLFAFVMAVLPAPPGPEVPDKIEHMVAFFTLTVLGSMAYPRLAHIRLMMALIAFGGLIELAQLVPALHRDSEWSDWLADIAAVIVAIGVAWLVRCGRTFPAE